MPLQGREIGGKKSIILELLSPSALQITCADEKKKWLRNSTPLKDNGRRTEEGTSLAGIIWRESKTKKAAALSAVRCFNGEANLAAIWQGFLKGCCIWITYTDREMEVCENKMKAEGWYRKYFETTMEVVQCTLKTENDWNLPGRDLKQPDRSFLCGTVLSDEFSSLVEVMMETSLVCCARCAPHVEFLSTFR